MKLLVNIFGRDVFVDEVIDYFSYLDGQTYVRVQLWTKDLVTTPISYLRVIQGV